MFPNFDMSSYTMSPLQINCASGICEAVCVQPFLVWKNNAQLNKPFTLNPYTLSRGFTANTGGALAITAQFSLYNQFASINEENTPPSLAKSIGLSALSATLSSPIACFSERIIIMQDKYKTNPISTMKILYSAHGFKSLFSGLITTIARDIPCGIFLLTMPPLIGQLLKPYISNDKTRTATAGVFSGVIGTFFSHAQDTVKTIQQESTVVTSLPAVAKELYKTKGLPGFLSGYGWRTALVTASIGGASTAKELLEQTFGEPKCRPQLT